MVPDPVENRITRNMNDTHKSDIHSSYGSTSGSDLRVIEENSALLSVSQRNNKDTCFCQNCKRRGIVTKWVTTPTVALSLLLVFSFLLGHFTTLFWIYYSKNRSERTPSLQRAQQLARAKLDSLNRLTAQKDMYYSNPLLAHLAPADESWLHDHPVNEPIIGNSKNHNTDPYTPLNGCEGTVIIIRHCEKGSLREHCAYIGYERAIYLSTLFGSTPDHRWPKPSYLYALSAGGRSNSNLLNWREIETLLPLSQRINVPIDDSYGIDQRSQLSLHLLTDLIQPGYLCGKVALISWKHDDIPRLAHELGCGPFDGCPDVYPSTTFDDAWQIKFAYHYPFHEESTTLNRGTESNVLLSSSENNNPQWFVYGTVLQENFDPLAFSKRMGDYSEEETGKHKWINIKGEDNVPENALGTISNNNSTPEPTGI